MKFDFLIWAGASALLAAMKVAGAIDWAWLIVIAPAVMPIALWLSIIVVAVIAWPFRWLAGARSSQVERD